MFNVAYGWNSAYLQTGGSVTGAQYGQAIRIFRVKDPSATVAAGDSETELDNYSGTTSVRGFWIKWVANGCGYAHFRHSLKANIVFWDCE